MTLLFVVSATVQAVTIRYQHTDMLGSVIAETDASGNVLSRSHYEPFGKRLGGDKAGIGFTGHLQDEDLNLTYMQARYYDPLIGRFYSNDPVGFRDVHSFNRYTYANNNPYKYLDPNGQSPLEIGFLVADLAELGSAISSGEGIGMAAAMVAVDVVGVASPIPGVSEAAHAIEGGTKVAKAATLAANRAAGAAGEARTAAKLGDSVAGKQISFKASDGSRSRADFVTKDGTVVETKTGGATLSSGQKSLQKDILSGNPVTPVGKNAEAAGFKPGVPVVLKDYKVDHQ